MCIVGVDAGRDNVKIYTPQYVIKFPSTLATYRERDIESEPKEHEYIIEYQGRKWFGGYLAKIEGLHQITFKRESKAHEQTIINILTALTNFDESEFKIITGIPIQSPKEDKKALLKLLNGKHEIIVNGESYKFTITAEVAKEGAGGFWANPQEGKIRILDFGSRTVNYATIDNYSYIDKESGTFDFGFNSDKVLDIEGMVLSITTNLERYWKPTDKVLLIGGGGTIALPYVKKYYANVSLINNPIMANAKGFYNIGEIKWQKE